MPSDKPDLCLGMSPVNGKMRYRLDGMLFYGPDAWCHLRQIGMTEGAADEYLDNLSHDMKERMKGTK